MWAVGDDRLAFVVDALLVEEFDQTLSEDLIEVLVTEPAGGVAVAGLHPGEDAEGDIGLAQE